MKAAWDDESWAWALGGVNEGAARRGAGKCAMRPNGRA